MDAVYLKQEFSDILLHVTLDGKDIKVTENTASTILLHKKLDSECPTCQCLLSINLIIHDQEESLKEELLKAECQLASKGIQDDMVCNMENSDVSNDENLFCLDSCNTSKNIVLEDHKELKVTSLDKNRPQPTYETDDATKQSFSSTGAVSVLKLNKSKEYRSNVKVLKNKIHRKVSHEPFEKHKRVGVKKCPELKGANTKTEETDRTRIPFCVNCYEKFNNRTELQTHLKGHETACRRCDPPVFFTNFFRMRLHFRNHHAQMHPLYDQKVACPRCNLKFGRGPLRTHMKKCVPAICNLCNKTYKDKRCLKKHNQTFHSTPQEVTQYTCHKCGKVYQRKLDFERHFLIHEDDPRPIKCDLCPTVGYKTKTQIRYHMDSVHLKKINPIASCPECGQIMKQQYLKQHVYKVHVQGRIFKCSFCEKAFAYLKLLQEHEKIHTDDRPYPCEICNQRFRQKSGLISHVRLHTGEKPYVCQVCQQRFADRGCYRSHLIKHEKELGITLDKSVKKFSSRS